MRVYRSEFGTLGQGDNFRLRVMLIAETVHVVLDQSQGKFTIKCGYGQ